MGINKRMKLQQILREGTWASPNTLAKANKLAALMKAPLPAKIAGDKLYHLVGDDSLFDTISELKQDGDDTDVRHAVAYKLHDWLRDYDPSEWRTPWEPEAIEVLNKAIKQFV